jgi:hypothetical protein
MISEYFAIIKNALSEGRSKNKGIYYEAHHIIPKSFKKKTGLVLLTPEEHYLCHKILALFFKYHPIYGNKMYWAFHRMTYSKNYVLSEETYAEARKELMHIWKKPKSDLFKKNMSDIRYGKKTMYNETTKQQKYIESNEMEDYLKNGWINSHKAKGRKMSDKQKKTLSDCRKIDLVGKTGLDSRASKGEVVYETIDGTILEAGSCLQLSYLAKIPQPTLSYRLNNSPGKMHNGYKVYYK